MKALIFSGLLFFGLCFSQDPIDSKTLYRIFNHPIIQEMDLTRELAREAYYSGELNIIEVDKGKIYQLKFQGGILETLIID